MRRKIIYSILVVLVVVLLFATYGKRMTPVYVAPESSQLDHGSKTSGIAQEFSPFGFLESTSDYKEQTNYTITYIYRDYNGKVLWQVDIENLLNKLDNVTSWPVLNKDFSWVSPEMLEISRYYNDMPLNPFARNWFRCVKLSPDGKLFGSLQYKPEGIELSLYKDGELLWKKSVNKSNDGPITGEDILDIFVDNNGSVLVYTFKAHMKTNYKPIETFVTPLAIVSKEGIIVGGQTKKLDDEVERKYYELLREYKTSLSSLFGEYKVDYTHNDLGFLAGRCIIKLYHKSSLLGIIKTPAHMTVDGERYTNFNLFGEKRGISEFEDSALKHNITVIGAKRRVFIHGVGMYKF